MTPPHLRSGNPASCRSARSDEDPRHLLAVGVTSGRCCRAAWTVSRRGTAVSSISSDVRRWPTSIRPRRGRLTRQGRHRAEHDARVASRVAVHAERHRHAEHREVEGPAPAELEIGRAQPVGGRHHDSTRTSSRPLGQILDAVVPVERRDGNDALARRARASLTVAPRLQSTGAVSDEDTAQQRGLPGATRQISPSFFMQKLTAFRHW